MKFYIIATHIFLLSVIIIICVGWIIIHNRTEANHIFDIDFVTEPEQNCSFVTYFMNNSNSSDIYYNCDTIPKNGYHSYMGRPI